MSLTDYDVQIAQMRARLEAKQEEFAALEAELVDLRQEMEEFEQEYHRRVGLIDEEIKKLDEEIERLRRRRVADLYGTPDPAADWRFGWRPPEDYVNASEQYQRAYRQYTPPKPKTGGLADRIRGGSAATVEETSVKKLYRRLARRFHPDLAETDADRAYRTGIMGQINEAYAARRLDELQAFLDLPDQAPGEVEQAPPAHIRLQQLEALDDELETKLAAMKRERDRLLNSSLMGLKIDERLARRQGRDLLGELAAAAQRELTARQQERERLRRAGG